MSLLERQKELLHTIEILRKSLSEYEKEIEKRDEKIKEDAPKVKFYDSVSSVLGDTDLDTFISKLRQSIELSKIINTVNVDMLKESITFNEKLFDALRKAQLPEKMLDEEDIDDIIKWKTEGKANIVLMSVKDKMDLKMLTHTLYDVAKMTDHVKSGAVSTAKGLCPVCYDRAIECSLMCGHSYCEGCVVKMKDKKEDIVQCPYCRDTTPYSMTSDCIRKVFI